MQAIKGHDDLSYQVLKLELAELLHDDEPAEAKQLLTDACALIERQLANAVSAKEIPRVSLICKWSNSTVWEAVQPAGSVVVPQQASLMRKVVQLSEKGSHFNTLAVTLFRIGQYEQAITACQQSINRTPSEFNLPGPHPIDFAFTAMCHHRLGNKGLAGEFKVKAEAAALNAPFKEDPEVTGAIRELQALFKKPVSTGPATNSDKLSNQES